MTAASQAGGAAMALAKSEPLRPGREAVAAKGWLRAHKWLLARRASQLGILAVFLAGPWFGVWIVKGNLSSSLTLGVLPLTDPYLLLQSLAAGQRPLAAAFTGAAIVVVFYLLVGGRAFCSWVCPVNLLTDAAQWARRRLGLKTGRAPAQALRWWLLGATFVLAALTGTLVWEWVNPVSMFHRGLIFGMGYAFILLAALFLYDLFVASRGWCGHVCPMGAFYGLLGKGALIRVSASKRGACNDCMDCYAVCPEPQVIRPALKAVGQDSPIVYDGACTNCGRCIDVCSKDVFRFTIRFDQRSES